MSLLGASSNISRYEAVRISTDMRRYEVSCPRCKETFRISKESGIGVVCPYCGMGSAVEWFMGQDGEDCRLGAPNLRTFPDGIPGIDFPGVSVQTIDIDRSPPTGVPEAMALLMEMMTSHMGIPPHLMGIEYTPQTYVYHRRQRMIQNGEWVVETGVPAVEEKRPYDYIKDYDLFDDNWECGGRRPTIIEQAQFMGMRVFNNRKRMRKRVRQRRRHFDPYDDHWTQFPGDW